MFFERLIPYIVRIDRINQKSKETGMKKDTVQMINDDITEK